MRTRVHVLYRPAMPAAAARGPYAVPPPISVAALAAALPIAALAGYWHVLDFEGGAADGVPSTMPWKRIRPWLELVHREMRRAGKHGSALRGYGATNEAELFAVAVEAFFEHPAQLQKKHAALYAMLVEALGQDPTAQLERDNRPPDEEKIEGAVDGGDARTTPPRRRLHR